MKHLYQNERGEVNMVAIVLIIVIVLFLAVIFREGLESLLKDLFQKVNDAVQNVF